MKYFTLYCVLFLLSIMNLNAQVEGVPFIANDKYGVYDTNGNTILSAIYEDVEIYNDKKIIAILKDGLWGISNMKGRLLLDHVIKSKSGYGAKGPSVSSVPTGMVDYVYISDPSSGMVVISDTYAKVKYFIHLYFP